MSGGSGNPTEMGRSQFSLAGLFVAMTGLCLLLGIAGWVWSAAKDSDLSPVALLAVLALFASFIIVALAKSSTL